MRRRKSSIGQLISTLVFLVMSIWLASAARAFYVDGQSIKAILVGFGSILAFVAIFIIIFPFFAVVIEYTTRLPTIVSVTIQRLQ